MQIEGEVVKDSIKFLYLQGEGQQDNGEAKSKEVKKYG